MLLRFGVGNFRSIRDYSEVSLVASDALKDAGPTLLVGPGAKYRVLPCLLIYGANASGKSSLYYAMGMMRSHVERSFTSRSPEGPIERDAFALNPSYAAAPPRFEWDFVLEGVRYHYGFEFNEREYTKEWLYSYPGSHRRILFVRDDVKNIEFGSTLKGRNKIISDLMRANSLFISTAAQNGHAQLTPIYSWFTDRLFGVVPSVDAGSIEDRLSLNIDDRIVPFLKNADTGIIGVNLSSERPPEELKALYRSFKEVVNKHDGIDVEVTEPREQPVVTLVHAAHDGGAVDLPLKMESRGTRRLIIILWSAFKALDNGGILFIDELDASLHTLLAMKLIDLFSDRDLNKNGAQLIATTHDTNILCSEYLRRDQIWFTEKDSEGATHVYPLTDIRTRNTDNLEKGYLQGRFGAVPFLGSIKALCSEASDG